MRKFAGWCFTLILGSLSVTPAMADDPAYTANFAIYKVHNAAIEILTPQELDERLNPAVEKILDSPITVSFEDVAVTEVFKFIREIYDLQFEMDPADFPGDSASKCVIQYLNLKGVALREALDAILIPLQLNYWIDGSVVRVVKNPSPFSKMPRDIQWYRPSVRVTVATTGAIRIGGSILRLSPESDGHIRDNDHVTRLAAPNIIVTPNHQAQLEMTSVVQWLKPIPGVDGDFRLQHSASPEGTKVGLLIKEASNDRVNCTVTLTVDSVRERHSVSGTTLNVGEPVFDTASGSAELVVTPGQPVALLTSLGADNGDVLLAVLRIDRGVGIKTTAQLPQYSVGTKIIQVRGEPDWQWWMQPYARASRIYEGAGRILGPVVVPRVDKRPKSFDWKRLGFSRVELSNPPNKDPGGIVHVVDSQFSVSMGSEKTYHAFRTNDMPAPRAPIDPSHPVFEAYRQVAPERPPLKPEDIQGKLQTLSVSAVLGQDGKPETRCDFFTYGEAFPTNTPGLYRIDQTVLLNHPRIETKEPRLRRTLEFSCESDGNDMFAFLLPIADDEYWIVLTDFSLAKE